jgi:uncharacterized GH25 family protein
MQRRVLALIALLLAAVVGFAVWRASSGPGVESIAATSERDAKATDAPSEKPPVPIAAPERSTPARVEPDRPRETATTAQEPRALAAQGAWEFRVDVKWPEGVPADEHAELVVAGRKTTDIVERIPLTGGGTYAVFLPKEHEKGRVTLDARYLFLEDPLVLAKNRRTTPIECAPLVGAWIHGRVTFPASLDPASREVADARVLRRGLRVSRDNTLDLEMLVSDTVPIAADGSYDCGGLSPERTWTVSLRLPNCVPHEHSIGAVEAGRSVEHDIVLDPGATVFGRVVDASGSPVPKARVVCNSDEARTRSEPRADETDDAGAFVLRGVAPGRSKLNVVCAGFVDQSSDAREYASGDVVRDVVIALDRGNALAGTVRWADGRPGEGAALRVTALSEDDQRRFSFSLGGEAPVATADAQGAFEISGLGAGPYEVRADFTETLPGEGRKKIKRPWRATLDSVEAGRRDLVLVLEPPRALVGTVRDDLGRPVPKFQISALPLDAAGNSDWDRRVTQAVSDETGAFRVEKVHPGKWDVSVEAKGYQDPAEQRVEIADAEAVIEFTCTRGTSLAGRVLDPDGKPIAGASIYLQSKDGERSWASSHAETDVHGEFHCTGQASGKVSLWAQHSNYAPSERQELELVPGGALAELTLHLRRGGSVEVQVQSPPGVPLDERWVSLSGKSDEVLELRDSERTDANGRAFFAHVAPGSYDVHAWSRGSGSEQATVDVVEGRTARVVLGRADGNAIHVTGRVTSGGEPLEDANVGFYFSAPGEQSVNRNAQTDSDGRYELWLDRPGKWHASLRAAASSRSGSVEVPSASTFVYDFELGTGSIAGTVFLPDGKAAARVSVQLVGDGADGPGDHGGWAQTDGRGRYSFKHVDAGRYRVVASVDDDGERQSAQATRRGIELAAGQKLEGQDVHLAPSAELEVHLVGAASKGDVWVQVTDANGDPVASEQVDADSKSVTFVAVPAGRATVLAWGEDVRSQSIEVELASGATRSLELELFANATATVHLVDGSGAAINGHATLTRVGESRATDYGGDARAEHVFERLSPGKYHVDATTESGAKGTLDFELAAGEAKTVEVVVRD